MKYVGLNVRWPWSQLLLSGEKTIETRHYPLPKKHRCRDLLLIETSGPNGDFDARAIGIIAFSGSKLYSSRREWTDDYKLHRVAPNDPSFSYDPNRPKWGWVVERVHAFPTPIVVPKNRGIVFTRALTITVPASAENVR